MPMEISEETVKNIDEDYPFSLSHEIILAMMVVMGIFMIVSVVIFIWYKKKTTPSFSTGGNLVKLIPSLSDNTPSLDSLLPII